MFDSRDSIPKNRKCECANEAQTIVVWDTSTAGHYPFDSDRLITF